MSVTSNALLRHITIDACLRDTAHKYSLADLIAACTKAVKENSKVKLKDNFTVSTRTVQLDLQFMRDKKKGYNAPIIVYEQKYYRYKDPNYSIGNANVKQTNLAPLSEIAETIGRYSRMAGMESLEGAERMIRSVIENKVSGSAEKIELPACPKTSGGHYLDIAKDAIIHRKVLSLSYYTENSPIPKEIIFYPMYLKPYMGRWYLMGYEEGKEKISHITMDCVNSYSYAILPFPPNYTFDAQSYFADIVGISHPSDQKEDITIRVKNTLAQYLMLNPIHRSQKLMGKDEESNYTFKLSIIPNNEFYRWLYSHHPCVTVISPARIAERAVEKMQQIVADIIAAEPQPAIQKAKKEKDSPSKSKKRKREEPPQEDLFSALF